MNRQVIIRFLLLPIVLLAVLLVAWQLARPYFHAEERQLRNEVRAEITQAFPAQAAQPTLKYGLELLSGASATGPDLVLVHGLDDPGKVWMNLAPRLVSQGYRVWEMHYPNDQPVAASARLLQNELVKLRALGVEQLTLIGHSMGGLVSREMLTQPQWLCEPGPCRSGKRPLVRQLIMVATPNHGSQMARFRVFTELREQVERTLSGEAYWMGWIADGAGEAGQDLLPGSPFLQALNARPHPQGTEYQLIAGVIGQQEREVLREQLQDLTGEPALATWLDGLFEGVGDGLVSLDSVRLDSAPLTILPGNHQSVIRNFTRDSERVPPAVPVILDLLSEANK